MSSNKWIGGAPTGASAPPEPVGVHDVRITAVLTLCLVGAARLNYMSSKALERSMDEIKERAEDDVLEAIYDEVQACAEAAVVGGLHSATVMVVASVRTAWNSEYNYSREISERDRIEALMFDMIDTAALRKAGFNVAWSDVDYVTE